MNKKSSVFLNFFAFFQNFKAERNLFLLIGILCGCGIMSVMAGMRSEVFMENVKELVELLIEKKLKIASAESCTGGLFASSIVSVPGSSEVIDASIVTYSNEAKMKYCGVSSETLSRFGAVSEEVTKEMAEGIARECNADIGVSFSGIAGPGGATETKPVGMVCFGIAFNGDVYTFTNVFKGNRTEVRIQSVEFMINTLLDVLTEDE